MVVVVYLAEFFALRGVKFFEAICLTSLIMCACYIFKHMNKRGRGYQTGGGGGGGGGGNLPQGLPSSVYSELTQ